MIKTASGMRPVTRLFARSRRRWPTRLVEHCDRRGGAGTARSSEFLLEALDKRATIEGARERVFVSENGDPLRLALEPACESTDEDHDYAADDRDGQPLVGRRARIDPWDRGEGCDHDSVGDEEPRGRRK